MGRKNQAPSKFGHHSTAWKLFQSDPGCCPEQGPREDDEDYIDRCRKAFLEWYTLNEGSLDKIIEQVGIAASSGDEVLAVDEPLINEDAANRAGPAITEYTRAA